MARQAIELKVDDAGLIAEPFCCGACGYPLQHLPRDGACPECGFTVDQSLAKLAQIAGEGGWARPLSRRLTAFAVGLALTNCCGSPLGLFVATIAGRGVLAHSKWLGPVEPVWWRARWCRVWLVLTSLGALCLLGVFLGWGFEQFIWSRLDAGMPIRSRHLLVGYATLTALAWCSLLPVAYCCRWLAREAGELEIADRRVWVSWVVVGVAVLGCAAPVVAEFWPEHSGVGTLVGVAWFIRTLAVVAWVVELITISRTCRSRVKVKAGPASSWAAQLALSEQRASRDIWTGG